MITFRHIFNASKADGCISKLSAITELSSNAETFYTLCVNWYNKYLNSLGYIWRFILRGMYAGLVELNRFLRCRHGFLFCQCKMDF